MGPRVEPSCTCQSLELRRLAVKGKETRRANGPRQSEKWDEIGPSSLENDRARWNRPEGKG